MSDEKKEKEVEIKEEKIVSTESKEEKKEVEVPKKFEDLVKQIEELSVLDLSELVKVLEEKFGVSASAPAMMTAAIPQASAKEEEKSDFDVELVAAGDAKIAIIKIVKEITGQGLKDAKDIVDAAPKIIKEKMPKTEAEDLKKKLEDAGATVNLK